MAFDLLFYLEPIQTKVTTLRKWSLVYDIGHVVFKVFIILSSSSTFIFVNNIALKSSVIALLILEEMVSLYVIKVLTLQSKITLLTEYEAFIQGVKAMEPLSSLQEHIFSSKIQDIRLYLKLPEDLTIYIESDESAYEMARIGL